MSESQNKFPKHDKTKIISSLVAFFILFPFSQHAFIKDYTKENAEQKKLLTILKKAGEYCSRLRHAALDFVCLEELSERIDYSRDIVKDILIQTPSGPYDRMPTRFKIPEKIEKNQYLYDYQFVRKGDETKERRTLLEENGKKKDEKNAQLKTIMFRYEKVLFGPIDLLGEERQHYHNYKIIGEGILNGEKAVILEAVPRPSLKQRLLFGRIWVNESDSSVLKIEWNQESIGNFEITEEIARRYKSKAQMTLVSEYGIEKNGIRFASRYYIEEAYISKKGKKFIRSETTVIYRDYKFFTVETEIKY